jgi:hypothetical protein
VRVNSSLSVVTVVAISLLACNTGQPTVEPTSDPAASTPAIEPEPEPEPVAPEPEAEPEQTPSSESPGGCQVQLLIDAPGAKGKLAGTVTLLASAKNLTDKPLELKLADGCPGGEAWFSGLETPDGSYDYYHTCTMGMCAPNRPPSVFALPPGEIVEIASTEISPDGKRSCNQPIAAGTYQLSFSLRPAAGASNPVLCGPEPLELRRK